MVEEARALLPDVLPVLEALRDSLAALRRLRLAARASARTATADGNLLADPWADAKTDPALALRKQAQEALTRLEAWGIEVKDAERGLIDFYHERDGEVVYLCYLLGEPALGYWHSLSAGFAGRQPLD
jgi:hypothetical protein